MSVAESPSSGMGFLNRMVYSSAAILNNLEKICDRHLSRTDEPEVSANHNERRLITNNCGNKYKTMFNLKIII